MIAIFSSDFNFEVEAQADPTAADVVTTVRPLFERFCFECHAGDVTEAEVDLREGAIFKDPASNTQLWIKVRAMLESGQMPPPESPRPTTAEMRQMHEWVHGVLLKEARNHAGDPGPVILRRLTNDEYNYTIRDLTGVSTLDPTEEFPVDGAAGEGFTNTGGAQAMSPSLVQKYLDAAKDVAGHLVLLPDGIHFSSATSRRDQTDQLLGQIQEFYRHYTADGGGTTVNLDGNQFTTNQGGLLPVESYIRATIEHRDAILNGSTSIEALAEQRGLSAKYLRRVWDSLTAGESSILLVPVRKPWGVATPEDADSLIAFVKGWQPALWTFHSIGHLGREGGATAWMEPKSVVAATHDFRFPLGNPPDTGDVTISLTAHDLADGNEDDIALWQQPRIEFLATDDQPAHSPILLKDLQSLVPRIRQAIERELPRTPEYLAALMELSQSDRSSTEVAEARSLNASLLANWQRLTGINEPTQREITGLFSTKLTAAHGYAAVNGWQHSSGASLITNRSDETVEFLTITMPPRSVTVHPWPTVSAVTSWKSPANLQLRLTGAVADADGVCGNGGEWQLELFSQTGRRVLAHGVFDNGGSSDVAVEETIAVATGDFVSLVISSRNRDHVCDTTRIELSLTEVGGEERAWDLATDVVDNTLESNPLRDSFGNEQTWHFSARDEFNLQDALIPPGSSLAVWRTALDTADSEKRNQLSERVVEILTSDGKGLDKGNSQLRAKVIDWVGPLDWVSVGQSLDENVTSKFGVDPTLFGRHPDGGTVDEADLCLRAPSVINVRLPVELARGATFAATGTLHPDVREDGSIQLLVVADQPTEPYLAPSAPLLVRAGSETEHRVRAAVDEFRQLFPPAICYARIVPVDETVTLTLFHREDDHLKRLMLDDGEAEELDRLWDELMFVSQEPLKLVVAFEQISEFATQDRPDLVTAFAPMRQRILERAELFRSQLIAAEQEHVEAVIELTKQAWRRPLTDDEQAGFHEFYSDLREAEIPHEEATRLLLARALASPAFLYRREAQPMGRRPEPVSGLELATRLSYFLWSSAPDDKLRRVAASGQLTHDDVLLEQTRRMLSSEKTRRLAVEFACQWLHVRNFDQNDEKNETLYPEFASLREPMYEETVRFFEDMFRNDGSILDLLDADHTFLNEALATHYGIVGVTGEQWRRVEGVRDHQRGGVLGMATFLASQSGASRTSPILRGNWVYETLLGERLPRPPPGVPQLPQELPEGLTARQLIEQHSSVPECVRCHSLIDPYGFALEQYDALGRIQPDVVDTTTTLVDGQSINGLAGLRDYLLRDRRDDVVQQFCRKLLGFALGREVQLSDEILLAELQDKLKEGDYRFHVAVETIVSSRQFRDIRGQQWTAE